MSVIQVRQAQPNWWEQLAANVVVPMISNALERQRQRDENRKQNAWLSEVLKMAGGADNGAADLLPPLSNTPGGNGWESAFHNTDNTLGSFGEAVGLTPQMTATLPQIQQQPTVTRDQLIQKGLELLGTKRFGGLNSADALKLLAPYMDAAEATRQEGMKKDAADAIMKATSTGDKLNTAYGLAIQGLVPQQVLQSIQGDDRYQNPHYQTNVLNTGSQQQVIHTNPFTGVTTAGPAFTNTLSPQEAAANQHSRAVLDETIRSNKANEAYRSAQLAEQSRPKLNNVVQLQDGRRVGIFSDGTERELTPDTAGFTSIETSRLTDLQTRRQGLITQQTALQTALAKAQTSEERASLQSSLNEVNAQIFRIDGTIEGMYRDKLSPQDTRAKPTTALWNDPNNIDIGAAMTRNAHDGNITTKYGTVRVKPDGNTYTHNGVDYATPKDTEILVPDVGVPLNVVKVGNDPDGYGNYVDLEGMLKGHTIEFRIAHMRDGVNVKAGDRLQAGDLIGLSGNTGNSRGKNGGYHMHLEVKLDGKYTDPTQFIKTIQPYIMAAGRSDESAIQQDNSPKVQEQDDSQTGQKDAREEYLEQLTKKLDNAKSEAFPTIATQEVPAGSDAIPMPPPARTALPANAASHNLPAVPSATSVGAVSIGAAGRSILSKLGAPAALAVAADMIWPKAAGETPEELQALQTQQGSGLTPVHTLEVTPTPQQTPTPSAATSWNPFAATPAYADDAPVDALSGASPDDGGLTQYRADGDTSPVTWRNASGSPMLTSNGQLFTQRIYDDWATQADAGKFRDVGINNRADLDKWLGSVGMSPHRPAEQRGLNNLNGRSNANLPPEGVDDGLMPFDSRPSTSPEKYPAPTFTDELNGTTPADTQDLLDGLNGITNSRYRNWTRALRQYYPSAAYTPDINVPVSPTIPEARPTPTGTPSSSGATSTQTQGSGTAPQRTAPAPRRAAPQPKRGYTNYEEQRNAVDTAAKNNGIDSSLIRAIIQVESGWKPTARSKAGAMGLMQLMLATARELGVRNAYDPAQNIAGGSKYIARLIRKYGGDVSKALMAYNCGPGNVAKGRIPQASRQYAQKVMSIYNRLRGQR